MRVTPLHDSTHAEHAHTILRINYITQTQNTHPDAHKLLMQYDPGQKVSTCHVRGEQRYGVGGQQSSQRDRVQERRDLPQQAKHQAAIDEAT